MIILRKTFSSKKILRTGGLLGMSRGRNYDMDLGRLGKGNTSRELTKEQKTMRDEIRSMGSRLDLKKEILRDKDGND